MILSEITDDASVQESLFERATVNPLMAVMDGINQRYGRDTIQVANQKRYTQKRRSPQWVSLRYTTNWDELLTVLMIPCYFMMWDCCKRPISAFSLSNIVLTYAQKAPVMLARMP